jgi:WhiB family transcriptional regulator, redox-sensing transcriptional regulator
VNAWWRQASCRGADPEIFYPIGTANQPVSGDRIELALAYCNRCPVTGPCLEDAEHHRDYHGIRAGLTEDQRRAARTATRADEAVA